LQRQEGNLHMKRLMDHSGRGGRSRGDMDVVGAGVQPKDRRCAKKAYRKASAV
jgi:hypothetical protein